MKRILSNWRENLIVIDPETVINWHRKGCKIYWKWKSRHHGGRPKIPKDQIDLIKQIANENPLGGVPRIHGEIYFLINYYKIYTEEEWQNIRSTLEIDLKMYEPAMRHLIDTYIRAEESEKISAFDDMSFIQLIVERGADAINALPKGIRTNMQAVAETIENNLCKVIIDEQPVNPKYYEKMSELLDALIKERKKEASACRGP
jgi:hypothetical protein